MTRPEPVRSSGIRVRLGDLDELRISVVINPYPSVRSIVVDSVAGVRRGLADHIREAVAGAVASPETARPLGVRPLLRPDCISPMQLARDEPLKRQLEFLRTVSNDRLAAALTADYGDRVPVTWRTAAERREPWCARFADAVEQAWRVVGPSWRRGRPLLDREVARVGTAVVRGGLDGLLASLSPNVHFAGGVLRVPGPDSDVELAGRRLVLLPMVAGHRALTYRFETAGATWLAYPAMGVRALWSTGSADQPNIDAVEAVLGIRRAAILRRADTPVSVSALAAALAVAPSSITYHCDQLVESGLITRHRHRHEVWISTTPRARKLIDALAHS